MKICALVAALLLALPANADELDYNSGSSDGLLLQTCNRMVTNKKAKDLFRSASVQSSSAVAQRIQGKIDKLSQAIKLNPNNALAYSKRGLLYILLQRYQEAVDDCSKSISLYPKNTDAYINRSLAYMLLRRYQEAIDDCNQVISLDPNSSDEVYYTRAVACYELGRYEKTIEDCGKAIGLNPKNVGVCQLCCYAYKHLIDLNWKPVQYQMAIDACTQASSFDLNDDVVYFTRAYAYYCLGQYKKTIEDCRTAANHMLIYARAAINWCIKNELIACENPWVGIKKYRTQPRERFLSRTELLSFFSALSDLPNETGIRDYINLCLFNGARRTNVLTMRWQDVDLDLGIWRIPRTKSGDSQTLPLPSMAFAILTERFKTKSSEWVFPGTGKTGHLVEPKRTWHALVRNAGLTDLHMHDLRRTLGSYMAMGNQSLQMIGKVLGHKSPTATQIYARMAFDPIREAMEKAQNDMLSAAGLNNAA